MGTPDSSPSFTDLGLNTEIGEVLRELGYEAPTPVQVRAIPVLMSGRDLIAQAQTGTGKTAAFALPSLQTLDLKAPGVQVLVLAPTRELAIQVAEAYKSYGKHTKRFHVLPIYGGQAISAQLRQLDRGPQVIVGTPGRVMDHLRRGSLSLENLKTLVMDEADEMLSMGFLEDIQWIMEQSPATKQTALFSATMPKPIRAIAERYLKDPQHVVIEQAPSDAALIDQSHWVTTGLHKLDALTRILEVSEVDGVLIFVRTKTATVELTEKLDARGYSAAALNGDMTQEARERTVDAFKRGRLDVVVATDVAARGLHVDRISHVINYDIPFDAETYTHRVGRTGRAGRSGTAILFVSPREYGLLKSIERVTGKRIPPFKMPSREDLASRRVERFVARVQESLGKDETSSFNPIVERLLESTGAALPEIAAALCGMIHAEDPIFLEQGTATDAPQRNEVDSAEQTRPPRREGGHRDERRSSGRRERFEDRPRRGGHRGPPKFGKTGGKGGRKPGAPDRERGGKRFDRRSKRD